MSGRGELQLAILIEMMPRGLRGAGIETRGSLPKGREDGRDAWSRSSLSLVDVPEEFIGVVTEALGRRKGQMTKMINNGSGRVAVGI